MLGTTRPFSIIMHFKDIFLIIEILTVDASSQVILPFTIAAYFIASYQYKIDPVMAFLGYSEYTFMNWAAVREPYVRRLLVKRAVATLLIALFVAAALSVLFILVPGTMF